MSVLESIHWFMLSFFYESNYYLTFELLSTPKTLTPMSPLGNENWEWESNPIPQPLRTYLFGSSFLANLAPPSKEQFQIKLRFKSRDHVTNSYAIKQCSIWRNINCTFWFKELLLSTKQKFEFSYNLIDAKNYY